MPDNLFKPRVIFSVTNSICFDQRVLKMAGVVRELGGEITIVGRITADNCNKNVVPFTTRRFRMIFRKGFLFYMFFNIRLFFFLIFHKCDILVSNDLDTLLPNWLVSRIKKVSLVFDSHEYFTGVPELLNRPFVRGIWKNIEKKILPHLQYVLTVSDPIAEIFENEYGIRVVTVRNCSPDSNDIIPFKRSELGIGEEQLIAIIQGGGINIDKGAEELIDAVKMCEGVFLIIAGSGDVIPDLKLKSEKLDLGNRVQFIPKVSWETLMRYTKSADIGMSLEKDTNINYRYSLPNKLFDYISAGIAVVAGDLPEISRVVTENSCGVIIPSVNPGEIAKAINLLDKNRDLLKVLKQNSLEASEILNWQNESVKVKEFYTKIFS